MVVVMFIATVQIAAEDQAELVRKGYFSMTAKDANGTPSYHPETIAPPQWVPFENIKLQAIQAIIVSEDSRFFRHEGLDSIEMKAAIEDSLFREKRWRGASTISQQMVKNVFLSHDRNLIRKIKEILIVRELERLVSKRKIIETYLNVIEFGEGIYGIHQAAKVYFNKHPSNLSTREGAFLAMLLPSPKRYSESWKEGKLSPYARTTMSKILKRLKSARFISKAEYQRSLSERFFWEREQIVAH